MPNLGREYCNLALISFFQFSMSVNKYSISELWGIRIKISEYVADYWMHLCEKSISRNMMYISEMRERA